MPETTHQGNANQNARAVTSQLSEGQTRDAATAGESEEERDPCALCVEMGLGAATTGNSVVAPQSSKTRTTMCPSNPAPGYLSEENKTLTAKETHTPVSMAAQHYL